MSYQSIKRVLGESSLERKCRILFGVVMLLLFGGAFLAADRVAERLVLDSTRQKAHNAVSTHLVRIHFQRLANTNKSYTDFLSTANTIIDNAGIAQPVDYLYAVGDVPERFEMTLSSLDEDGALQQAREAKALRLGVSMEDDQSQLTMDEIETVVDRVRADRRKVDEIAEKLKIWHQRQMEAAEQKKAEVAATTPVDPNGEETETDDESGEEINASRILDEEGQFIYAELRPRKSRSYHYYAPVVLTDNCKVCHDVPPSTEADLAATDPDANDFEYYVVKLELPDEGTLAAINWIRAILTSVAIVTVFIAMLTSYVIVRYVIVKPLRHLRDVSDEISRGEMDLRAELRTGDEFEELAASFNRMLRHLIDTQQELREVNRDLDRNVDELAQLNMRLYEMNQLKGEFLANMSHELRTPLNSIIGFSEVLGSVDSLSDKQRRYANNIRRSGQLLLDMINDILDLAKIDAGKMEIKPSEFRIEGVIAELCDMVRSLAEEKNIDLQIQTDPQIPPLYQDQVKIQQILTNLLSNAIKFTPEGGRITVSARRRADTKLELSVRDTGVGIAEEDRAIIFEKFRQGKAVLGTDGLTREYSGTGLGLSIVKELARLLHGEVSIESEVGKGSVFTVVLPWECPDEARRDYDLSTRLDELTKPKRVDFDRARLTPTPPG